MGIGLFPFDLCNILIDLSDIVFLLDFNNFVSDLLVPVVKLIPRPTLENQLLFLNTADAGVSIQIHLQLMGLQIDSSEIVLLDGGGGERDYFESDPLLLHVVQRSVNFEIDQVVSNNR